MRHLDKALELFNAGFTSKVAVKRCNESLAAEYRDVVYQVRTLNRRRVEAGVITNEQHCEFVWGLPDLHNWKAKHSTSLAELFADELSQIERLVEIRAAVKAAPINKEIKTATEQDEVIAQLRQVMLDQQLTSMDKFDAGSLEYFTRRTYKSVIWATPHIVVNDHGTVFMRCFWYLNGRFTTLGACIAAIQAEGK